MKFKYLALLSIAICFAACKSSITPDELYGKWKYIKVEHPHANPPDSLSADEIKADAPSIEFSRGNQFVIIWGGKTLSHGKFSVQDKNILISEDLPDGTKRNFPFWVSKLTNKEIVFETKGDENSRVTATKE